MKTSRAAFLMAVLVGLVVSFVGAAEEEEAQAIRHSFFVAGSMTGIVGEDGKVLWDSKMGNARDGYVLDNGHILICWGDEVREYDKDKKVIFSFKRRKGVQELGTAQRLENGNTLITELGQKPRLLEVDKSGKVLVSVPLKPETNNKSRRDVHMQTRMARKLANGNYLVPHLLAFAVKEYTPKGEVVNTFKTDLPEIGGRKQRNWPFTAIRLANGNTLINCTNGNKTIEVDGKGKIVWMASNGNVKGKPFADPCGGQRLPNGNTVIASYGARGKGAIKMFEITRDRKVVWSQNKFKAHHFQILTTNGKPVGGSAMK